MKSTLDLAQNLEIEQAILLSSPVHSMDSLQVLNDLGRCLLISSVPSDLIQHAMTVMYA